MTTSCEYYSFQTYLARTAQSGLEQIKRKIYENTNVSIIKIIFNFSLKHLMKK